MYLALGKFKIIDKFRAYGVDMNSIFRQMDQPAGTASTRLWPSSVASLDARGAKGTSGDGRSVASGRRGPGASGRPVRRDRSPLGASAHRASTGLSVACPGFRGAAARP